MAYILLILASFLAYAAYRARPYRFVLAGICALNLAAAGAMVMEGYSYSFSLAPNPRDTISQGNRSE